MRSLDHAPHYGLSVDSADSSLLVGRERERRLLGGLVTAVDGAGSAVVVLGEAGMGKTSLLACVEQEASRQGARVLRARGVESEAVLPFATIADLLLPLQEHFGRLPDTQREALEVCLALSHGPGPGPLAVCAGALGVLTAAAEERPLVVLVDDFQWLDAESAQILLFVARRLAVEHIVMVLAVRDEPDRSPRGADLPVLRLTGLSLGECAELALLWGSQLPSSSLARMVEETGGNPLAVVEYLRAGINRPAVAARGASGSSPELHPSLERTWGRLWRDLPAESRRALFVLAADHVTDGRHVPQALAALGLSIEALVPAEQVGLVGCVDGEIRMRHPLLRSVVHARTAADIRAACYRALAGVAEGELHTWYLAAATTGSDETLAEALATGAAAAQDRSGWTVSARMLHRAAELTGDRGLRGQRLLQAAQHAHLAGDAHLVLAWCEQALTCRDDPVFAVDVEQVACRARTWLGDTGRAFEGVMAAAARVRPVAPARAAQALTEAAWAVALQGEISRMRQVAEQVEAIWTASPEVGEAAGLTEVALMAEAFTLSGEIHLARQYWCRAEAMLGASDHVSDPQGILCLAQSLGFAERYEDASRHLAAGLTAARALAAPPLLSFALATGADIRWWTGQWTTAYADATEAVQWTSEAGHPALASYSLGILARLEAARGDREAGQALIDPSAQPEVARRGIGCTNLTNVAALGLAALGYGDLTSAAQHLQSGWENACEHGVGNPSALPVAGDLAEALARAGQAQGCARVVRWLDERAETTGLAYPRAAARRADGILAADPEQAQHHFGESLAALEEIGPVPFEQARTLLCAGESLRRGRRPAAARGPLERALSLFDALGAKPWSARAVAELAASGAKIRDHRPAASDSLTLGELSPQELQVARAAGRGLNNLEIAAALFLSRKTVEAHLTRVYRKLAVRSRTELTRTLLANGITD